MGIAINNAWESTIGGRNPVDFDIGNRAAVLGQYYTYQAPEDLSSTIQQEMCLDSAGRDYYLALMQSQSH